MGTMMIPATVLFLLLAAGSSDAGQSGGGLRVFEAEHDDVCRDASPSDPGTRALLGEMQAMLVRMKDLQARMGREAAARRDREIEAELERMRVRTEQMLDELERTVQKP